MSYTFGDRPSDVVTDEQGNVLSGVTLTLYASKTDAQTANSPITTVTTDSTGRWTYTDATRDLLYVRTSSGSVYAVATSDSVASGVNSLTAGDSTITVGGTATAPTVAANTGSAAGTVAAGDDSRLSDARTPTAHASTHASGGTDPVTPAAIGALSTVTAADVDSGAATSGQVLEADGAGGASWATIASGGGNGPFVPSGVWCLPGIPISGLRTTGQTNAANYIYLAPFYLGGARTATSIGIGVVSAYAASATAELGIYSYDLAAGTWSLVLDAGSVAIDTTGDKSITISQSLPAGAYGIAVLTSDGTGSLVCWESQGTLGMQTTTSGNYTRDLRAAQAYGPLPSTTAPSPYSGATTSYLRGALMF